jgi:hypothetical protein
MDSPKVVRALEGLLSYALRQTRPTEGEILLRRQAAQREP